MELPRVPGSVFAVIVKTRSSRPGIIIYDEEREAYTVTLAAVPDKGKANKELLALLATNGLRCEIISGSTSRKKLLRVIAYSSSSKKDVS